MAHIVHEDSLESEIQRRRERLAACSRDHPQRGDACQALASSLHDSWNKTPSSTLLSEAIALYREGLALQPSTHPDRGKSCSHLANALLDQYRAEGGHDLLEETIKLHRKSLSLRSAGHPDRSYSCNGLARALLERYRVSGGSDVLDETIKLHREALSLQPSGHPDRAMYCNDLASTLHDRNQMKGSSGLLDEMIKLHREALALRPAEHPDHASSCNNLANALMDRYEVTGTTALLDEAITLYHNTRNLRPGAHPFRAMACSNLANALLHRYRATGVSTVLDDTITLCREALALRSAAHYGRAMSCTNLAGALLHRYQDTGDSALLDEVIKLHREALALRPGGHPSRGLSCYDLAGSLWRHCQQTQDQTVINEAVTLARQSATSWSPSDSWQPLLLLCSIHLEQWSPYFSISTATEYLLQAASSVPSNIAEFMREIQSRLDRMWLINATWTPDTPHFMVEVYSKIIDRLSGMTGFAFDLTSQLTALRTARSFGSDACVAALLSGLPCQAIELIDHAHGLIWAQALHQRDPQLQDIPRSLASELEALLRGVSKPLDTHAPMTSDSTPGYLPPEDVRHEQKSRIQTILTDVRAMPGLERFMLGRSYTQLRETASEHPVVVLVSARGHSYALIVRDSTQAAPDKIHLKLTSDRLSLLRDTAARAGLRQGVQGEAAVKDLQIKVKRAMRMSRHKEVNPLATLADVWHDVVKPVFEHLQLQVRIREPHFRLLS
jgi:tetratricopeptide (TPR) repeat protein